MGERDIDLVVEQALWIAEKLVKVSRARSATSKISNLTEGEIVLLNLLAKRSGKAVGIRDVLQETGFSPSRLSKVIKELESGRRFIRSRRIEGDRRRVELMLLGQGLKALAGFKRLRKKRLRLVFQQLSQEDFKMVSEAVALFSQALDKALLESRPFLQP
jgi:DNA-binding MarR family transcriptional regulator